MMLTDAEITTIIGQLIGSFVLLIVILIISKYKGLKIHKTIIVSGIRGLLQLLALSMVLIYIFSITQVIYQFIILGIMITFGAHTASKRLEIENIFKVEIISLFISVYFVMTIITLTKAIPISDPAIFIPIGGMAAGNAMNISYLTLNRIKNDLDNRKDQIETALSLGFSPSEAVSRLEIISSSMRMGITPSMNNLKTLGLVFIPGLMTGLLIGGVNPVSAAIYQIMIFFVIIAGGSLSSMIASYLVLKELFDTETMSYKY